jgi:hypothetical protein
LMTTGTAPEDGMSAPRSEDSISLMLDGVQYYGLMTTSLASPRNKISKPFSTSRPTIRS